MSRASPVPARLRATLAADLLANTGRRGLAAALSSALYDPSFATVLVWRLAVRLRTAGLPRLAKLLWRLHVMLSACHLHLDATAGPGLKLPHPTGVTLGVGVRLGPRVTVYQHVTIGAGFRDRSYPVIGEGAILFPGAVVVGGITVGARAVVGANAVVLADVPADAVVAGNPARIIRSTAPQAGAALPQDL